MEGNENSLRKLKGARDTWSSFFDKYQKKNSASKNETYVTSTKISTGKICKELLTECNTFNNDEIYASTEAQFSKFDNAILSLLENNSLEQHEYECKDQSPSTGAGDADEIYLQRSSDDYESNFSDDSSVDSVVSEDSFSGVDDFLREKSIVENALTDDDGCCSQGANSQGKGSSVYVTVKKNNSSKEETNLKSDMQITPRAHTDTRLDKSLGSTAKSISSPLIHLNSSLVPSPVPSSSLASKSSTDGKISKRFILLKNPSFIPSY